ncbi:MAG TPA: condensation domain-containing protein, partial [Thermoanaerobaculia bacterium]
MNPNHVEMLDELSPMQQAMLFHSLMAPGSGVYVIQMSLRMTGGLDLPAFEQAWRSLVARHPVLRTAFFWEDMETPRQVTFREVSLEITRTSWRDVGDVGGIGDIGGMGAAEQEERLAAFLAADRARGFDLAEAPLLRLALFELAEDVHQLVWTQHHLITDGWSQGLVLHELLRTYGALTAGHDPALPPVPGFHEYLVWLQRQDLGANEAFWRRSLDGFSTPTFLAARTDRTERIAEPDGTDARRRDLALPAAVSAALRAVARRRRLTLNTLAQGAWALLLAQESSREDVAFGVTAAGRPADLPGAESIVGPFLNTLPLRVRLAPEHRLHGWLAGLQEQQVEARRHEHAPLVDVQRWSGLPAGVALFDHILVFENLLLPEESAHPVAGLKIEEGAGSSLTNYPLNVVVVPGNELLLSLRWDGARCGGPETVRLLERLARLLTVFSEAYSEGGSEKMDPRLDELPLLLAGERQQLLREWNDTADSRRSDLLLHQLFAAQVEARPDALAAVWEGRTWTYRELAERAHRLAALLGRLGVERGTTVGVWMERSLDMLAAVIGILEAGGTYVPLDAAWPADRVETILTGTGAPVILTSRATLPAMERLRWRLPRLDDVVCLDVETQEPEPEALDTAAIRSLFDFVADRATDRVTAGGFVSRRTGLPFSEAEVDEYRDRVLSLAAPWLRPGARVLEVGSGSGLILWEMARRVGSSGRIVGLDPSGHTQECNREHARAAGVANVENVELPTGFAHEIGERFGPGSFDLVLFASTVQFFPGPRYLEKVVAEAMSLLAPGGALLLADVIDARREAAGETLALDEELFRDLGRAEIHHRTEGFANELGERYDVLLQPGEVERRKRTWTGWHVGQSPATQPVTLTSPEDVAYIIHTSGSTGLPKGIAVQHAPAVNLIHWINRTFGVGRADRLLFITSLAFDLSVWDIFGMLAAGGTVHVASEAALREPAELVRLLTTEPVTVWDSAPAALQQLAPLFPDSTGAPSPLCLVMLSGDWIPVTLPDQVRTAFPSARVISLGGATEATVWSNWYPLDGATAVDPSWPSIPYGRPIGNARYHALDASLRPCPIGVPGDLFIGGDCLSVGYTVQPEMTATSYLPDPFAGEPGARLYRTGDRVRYFPDGNLEFLGRVDQQVKIHGYRIELGEIEVALLRHRQVREAVMQVLDGRLVAWVVPRDGETAPEAQGLRAWLAESLPSYMLPAAFVVLATLPVTPNGKLDRAALPAPELAQAAEYAAPSGAEEEMLAALWGELLGVEQVGAHDNFFTLGGHSLLATRVVSRLRSTFEVEISLRSLFEAPTVAELARVVRASLAGQAAPSIEPIVPIAPILREVNPPLSFAQQRLWFLDQLDPGSPVYNIPFA